MNRFVWDLRYAGGPAGGGDGEGGGFGGGGPLVAPGSVQGAAHRGRRDEDRAVHREDRSARSRRTASPPADLAEQTKFALKVRDALAEARALAARVRQAIEAKRGDQAKLQTRLASV